MTSKEDVIKAIDAFRSNTDLSSHQILAGLEFIQEHASDLILNVEEEIDNEDDDGDDSDEDGDAHSSGDSDDD